MANTPAKSESAVPDGYVVALQNLYLPDSMVLAVPKGGFVLAENVEPNGWGELVAKPGTKAADAAAQV